MDDKYHKATAMRFRQVLNTKEEERYPALCLTLYPDWIKLMLPTFQTYKRIDTMFLLI